MAAGTEPFPQLQVREKLKPNGQDIKVRPRRKSSGLGGEIRAGDTGVPAIATWDVVPPSPGAIKVFHNSQDHDSFSILTFSRRKLN
jgi:acyl-CoA-dependent ceramide synthase